MSYGLYKDLMEEEFRKAFGGVLFFSAYLCVPLRLCGKQVVRAHFTAEAQRYAEIHREEIQNKTRSGILQD
jgi:hypothetical protein